MKFAIYLCSILLAIVLLMLISRHSRIEFVHHANLLFRTWSVWLASLGSALSAWVQSFPDAAMRAWQQLPPEVKAIIPQNYLGMIGAFMVAMAVIAQFVRQNSLAEQRQKLDQNT